MQAFLGGVQVDPVWQGRTSGLYEIERLLLGSPDGIKEIFENAAKAMNK